MYEISTTQFDNRHRRVDKRSMNASTSSGAVVSGAALLSVAGSTSGFSVCRSNSSRRRSRSFSPDRSGVTGARAGTSAGVSAGMSSRCCSARSTAYLFFFEREP